MTNYNIKIKRMNKNYPFTHFSYKTYLQDDQMPFSPISNLPNFVKVKFQTQSINSNYLETEVLSPNSPTSSKLRSFTNKGR